MSHSLHIVDNNIIIIVIESYHMHLNDLGGELLIMWLVSNVGYCFCLSYYVL